MKNVIPSAVEGLNLEFRRILKKPSIPKGTRDFSPEEVSRRNYIFNIIRETFSLYGFQPIETPSFENSDTLMGKYGEEGDRLIFRILESGEYFEKAKKKLTPDNIENMLEEFLKRFLMILRPKAIAFINNNCDIDDDWNTREQLAKWFDQHDLRKEIINEALTDSPLQKYKEKLDQFFWNHSMYTMFNLQRSRKFFNYANEEEFADLLNNISEKLPDLPARLKESLKFNIINEASSNELSAAISEKALRYDLTVPFARYVVQHQNEITFPFKRYQIQPVWRADRPQKGRFREFFQCDADVVGSKSLWQEVEFVQLYDAVFSKLSLKGVTIKLNNRKILSGIAETIGAEDKLIDFTVALDKLDKIGGEGVKKEMREKGISDNALQKLQPLFSFDGANEEKLNSLKGLLHSSQLGMQGVEELTFIIEKIKALKLQTASLEIDVTLARGLNYYTGAIIEVSAPTGVDMGSVGGGGRYDDLTGIFGLPDVSGVGISFGLDRIELVMEQLDLFPATVSENTKVLFINFGEKESLYAMQAIKKLRLESIKAELYPDATKMGKQMGYADKRNIPFVILAGEKEIEAQSFTLKNMKSGEQSQVNFSELETLLKQ